MSIVTQAAKLEYFEFTISKLIQWYCQENLMSTDTFSVVNDFSKLKVLKLHFFVCAINSNRNHMLDIFDSFYAMPYGHVESELYNAMNLDKLQRFTFTESSMQIKTDIAGLDQSFSNEIIGTYRQEVIDAIGELRKTNKFFVNYTALTLVDLSHLWTSWKATFRRARENHKFSERIPANIIQSESKFFTIA